mmetsp:Transcript_43639/g.92777  ORF Transcript_43639/g.92777 Transcript_43639/m.92777 type:complete len:304 (-) Transcript_43639:156-1067(-)|eukprot:CAMPEP_0172528726 /NCGR_PEP_ID=MMETSP1067-20121228/3019_1 /TAXON_ID=265564 ORGANISM="Thalassiosira punctigera, Strain Tpunct2005C2" /NCGR_SAMPLE_ID=MMETSP1067 /ASSEMBLY_ACC=CAM_ASM_000444 /LENGTH=303 /DNA_ID=CAMNT_0013312685 /DNA_START=103 /DNA_END=1014 /DNA_ORIENTATION=-
MSTADEATVNPDGSTTFNDASDGAGSAGAAGEDMHDMDAGDGAEEIAKGVDPALYLALAVVAFVAIFLFLQMRKKRRNAEVDDFFSNLDGDKFNLKLPAAVDEYYEVKGKCEADGWEPGQAVEGGSPSAHHRMLAQALMKRCIADIPIVSHIQRESPGMNKLYSQSMCSVKQWKSYQAAEAMVSAEVEEVRAEADEIEPGWSQVVWRQAMQYHNMLKQKEEQAKAQQAAQQKAIAEKKKEEDEKKAAEKARYDAIKKKVDEEKARIANAEKAAAELMKQEEREKESKKAFSSKGGGMKKGFLE